MEGEIDENQNFEGLESEKNIGECDKNEENHFSKNEKFENRHLPTQRDTKVKNNSNEEWVSPEQNKSFEKQRSLNQTTDDPMSEKYDEIIGEMHIGSKRNKIPKRGKNRI